VQKSLGDQSVFGIGGMAYGDPVALFSTLRSLGEGGDRVDLPEY
jgi:hypothetical protein